MSDSNEIGPFKPFVNRVQPTPRDERVGNNPGHVEALQRNSPHRSPQSSAEEKLEELSLLDIMATQAGILLELALMKNDGLLISMEKLNQLKEALKKKHREEPLSETDKGILSGAGSIVLPLYDDVFSDAAREFIQTALQFKTTVSRGALYT